MGSGDIVSSVVPWLELNVSGIPVGGFDVVEPGQRVEVVLIVAINGRLVAEPLPERVRVDSQLWADRVPGELCHVHLRWRGTRSIALDIFGPGHRW